MESITLGQIMAVCAVIVAIGGFVTYFYKLFQNLKKYMTRIIVTELEPIKDQLVTLDSKIDKVDLESCKNFLVRFLSDVEKGVAIDEIQTARFWEEYEHYEKQGGNSYIHQKVEKLKAKNLI